MANDNDNLTLDDKLVLDRYLDEYDPAKSPDPGLDALHLELLDDAPLTRDRVNAIARIRQQPPEKLREPEKNWRQTTTQAGGLHAEIDRQNRESRALDRPEPCADAIARSHAQREQQRQAAAELEQTKSESNDDWRAKVRRMGDRAMAEERQHRAEVERRKKAR